MVMDNGDALPVHHGDNARRDDTLEYRFCLSARIVLGQVLPDSGDWSNKSDFDSALRD